LGVSGGVTAGRSTNRLSDRSIRAFVGNVRAGNSPTKKLSDGGGLYLAVTPAGSAVWRLKYRHGGKEKLYAIGVYPEISLESARAERDAVKAHLREGRDPSKARQVSRAIATSASRQTFGSVANSWLSKRKADWSDIHYSKSKQALERDVFPALGKLPVDEITPAMIAAVIEKITRRGALDTAGKILWNVNCVFRFAQARGLCRDNPALPVREVIPKKRAHSQRPALLKIESLGELLRRFEGAPVSPAVRIAHRLVAYTGSRIGNVIGAEWKEFDLDGDLPSWTVPRNKMKARDRTYDHRVLLGPTIATELRIWRSITGGRGFVFPSPTGRAHITHESIEKALRVTLGMEGKHSVHGWRASLSTLARDAGFSRDVVELTLDHVHDSQVARAYDRGERLAERERLMYWWDSQLSGAQHGTRALPLRSAGAG
jgi:integrase